MNSTKIALLSTFCLIAGAATLSAPSFAAEPDKDPPASKPATKPDASRSPCDEEYGMRGGYGPGMMGGYGQGMMGRQGPGMTRESPRIRWVLSLDLNDDQRSRINKLIDELEHNNWATRGLINDESAKLRDLYGADKRDPSAIGKQYQKIFDLRRQMIEATITAENRIEDLLTPDQRSQLKKMHHWRGPMRDYPR